MVVLWVNGRYSLLRRDIGWPLCHFLLCYSLRLSHSSLFSVTLSMPNVLRSRADQPLSQDGDVNPFKSSAPFSPSYRKILLQRKGLPVYQKMQEFLDIFNKNQITVMEGQTGSGKTTQIPQFVCYSDLPMLRGKMVACTQPRRVAAMSVAKRVADEMDGESRCRLKPMVPKVQCL